MGFEWDWRFAAEILPALLQATGYTVLATFVAFAGALVLGLPVAVARRSRFKGLRLVTGFIVEFIRSTPLLIQIYFIYFVLPSVGLVLSALTTGIAALTIHYGAYASEAYRAGLDSVPQSQKEAAAALGLKAPVIFFKIILPQAVRPIVPALGNYLIALFKETPLLSAIAVVELLQTAKLIGSETFRYNEPITLVGAIFLVLTLVSSVGIRKVEQCLRLPR